MKSLAARSQTHFEQSMARQNKILETVLAANGCANVSNYMSRSCKRRKHCISQLAGVALHNPMRVRDSSPGRKSSNPIPHSQSSNYRSPARRERESPHREREHARREREYIPDPEDRSRPGGQLTLQPRERSVFVSHPPNPTNPEVSESLNGLTQRLMNTTLYPKMPSYKTAANTQSVSNVYTFVYEYNELFLKTLDTTSIKKTKTSFNDLYKHNRVLLKNVAKPSILVDNRLKIGFFNVNLSRNITPVFNLLNVNLVDVFGLVEMDNAIKSGNDLFHVGFKRFFYQRQKRSCGGICAYINNKYFSQRIRTKCFDNIDTTAINIKLSRNAKKCLKVVFCYFSAIKHNNDDLFDFENFIIDYRKSNNLSNIIFIGDFNTKISLLNVENHDTRGKILSNIVLKYKMKFEGSDCPTRFAKKKNEIYDSNIDFCILGSSQINTPCIETFRSTLHASDQCNGGSISDHEGLLLRLRCKFNSVSPVRSNMAKSTQLRFNKKSMCDKHIANLHKLFEDYVFTSLDIYEYGPKFLNYILDSLKNTIPMVKINEKTKHNVSKEKKRDVLTLRRLKRLKIHYKNNAARTVGTAREIRRLRKLISQHIFKQDEANKLKKCYNKSKVMSDFKKNFAKKPCKISKIMNDDDEIINEDDIEIANVFANFFENVIKTIKVKKLDFIEMCLTIINKLTVDASGHVHFSYDNIRAILIMISLDVAYSQHKESVIDKFSNMTGVTCAVIDFLRFNVESVGDFDKFVFNAQFDRNHKIRIEKNHLESQNFEKANCKNNKRKMSPMNVRLNRKIELKEIMDIIKKLPNNKAPGWDNIPIELIRIFSPKMISLLCKFYDDCLRKHFCPAWFKKAFIIPLYKKGDKLFCNNYRPIKLLSILGKILECIVTNRLRHELDSHLHESQAGFRKKFECLEQHVHTLSKIEVRIDGLETNFDSDIKTIKRNKHCTGIFLDISKAFDRVWRKRLLNKLYVNFGIKGDIFLWLCDYFNDRRTSVRVNNQFSDDFLDDIGVPQGSVLGPLLFLFFMDDLFQNISCEISVYADDILIFSLKPNFKNQLLDLNKNLHIIYRWAYKNRVIFDGPKFKAMEFGLGTMVYNRAIKRKGKSRLEQFEYDQKLLNRISKNIYKGLRKIHNKPLKAEPSLTDDSFETVFELNNTFEQVETNSTNFVIKKTEINSTLLKHRCTNTHDCNAVNCIPYFIPKIDNTHSNLLSVLFKGASASKLDALGLANVNDILCFDGKIISFCEKFYTWLGIRIDPKLNFKAHLKYVHTKVDNVMWVLRSISNNFSGIDRMTGEAIFQGIIQPLFTYGIAFWGCKLTKADRKKIDDLIYEGARIATGIHKKGDNDLAIFDLQWNLTKNLEIYFAITLIHRKMIQNSSHRIKSEILKSIVGKKYRDKMSFYTNIFPHIEQIQILLNCAEIGDIWYIKASRFKSVVKSYLKSINISNWRKDIRYSTFKNTFNIIDSKKHFQVGSRRGQTLTMRYRSGNYWKLNAYKYRHIKGHHKNDNKCKRCGVADTCEHVIMNCTRFDALREVFFNSIQQQKNVDVKSIDYDTIIGGDVTLPSPTREFIELQLQTFLINCDKSL